MPETDHQTTPSTPAGERSVAINRDNHGTIHTGDTYHVPGPAPRALSSLPPLRGALYGRRRELDELVSQLRPDAAEQGSVVVVCAVEGAAGVGKTALALHAAHRALDHSDWFPGGALFLTMQGDDNADRLTPDEAVRLLLRHLGVRNADMPPTATERVALYRSKLADLGDRTGPALLVIDNAHPDSHLDTWLPGRGRHRLLITSRHRLTSSPDHRLVLDVLPAADAATLLGDTLTAVDPTDARISDEPALERVINQCGRLPAALLDAARRLTDTPDLTLAGLTRELQEGRTETAVRIRERATDTTSPRPAGRSSSRSAARTSRSAPVRLPRPILTTALVFALIAAATALVLHFGRAPSRTGDHAATPPSTAQAFTTPSTRPTAATTAPTSPSPAGHPSRSPRQPAAGKSLPPTSPSPTPTALRTKSIHPSPAPTLATRTVPDCRQSGCAGHDPLTSICASDAYSHHAVDGIKLWYSPKCNTNWATGPSNANYYVQDRDTDAMTWGTANGADNGSDADHTPMIDARPNSARACLSTGNGSPQCTDWY